MAETPIWIKQGRAQWEFRGQKRPDFAKTPKQGEESVWDYPRPPKLESDRRIVTVQFKGILIAETQNAVRVLETASPPTFYIPPSDIKTEFIKKAPGTSLCEWKGKAEYWDVLINDKVLEKAGWCYPDPFEEFTNIKEHLSFYPSVLECFVDGERVRPQPGGFYGGWITSEIVGPVKGEIPEASL